MTANHQVYQLDDATVDRADRFGWDCATGKCTTTPTHATRWTYVTGRRGRVATATRHVCEGHAVKFAAKHGLSIGDPQPEPPSAFTSALTAMTGDATVDQVRVHNSGGVQWYLQRHRSGPGTGFDAWNSWMGGVPGDATLEQAITEAEHVLARQDRLVVHGEWRRVRGFAVAAVIPAQRSAAWFTQPWDLTVARLAEGMWTLTRVLAPRFAPITDDLGDHNMSLDRALRVAAALLAEQGWVTFTNEWSTYADDTAALGAWHPDQASQQDQETSQPRPHVNNDRRPDPMTDETPEPRTGMPDAARAFHAALAAGDMKGVDAALRVLAVHDPHLAERLLQSTRAAVAIAAAARRDGPDADPPDANHRGVIARLNDGGPVTANHAVLLAHALLAIAEDAMPDTYLATDFRCRLARAVIARAVADGQLATGGGS